MLEEFVKIYVKAKSSQEFVLSPLESIKIENATWDDIQVIVKKERP